MAETVQVSAARIPDRDRLLLLLVDHGLPAEPVGEIEIKIPCDEADEAACDEILEHVEAVVFDLGAPFVPMKHDGVIYVRPPIA
jgi:hypothetical protein